MEERKMIIFELKRLSNLISRQFDSLHDEEYRLTRMQGGILGYLIHCKKENVFQKDIEVEFGIRRSTATEILKLMEKNHLIRRIPFLGDGRLKKLEPTEEAKRCNTLFLKKARTIDQQAVLNISENELDMFYKTLDKIKKNLGGK